MTNDLRRVKLGDRVSLPIYPAVPGYSPEEGVVVYIHPQRRYFTVEFTTILGRKIRQSYIPSGPHKIKE